MTPQYEVVKLSSKDWILFEINVIVYLFALIAKCVNDFAINSTSISVCSNDEKNVL